MKTILLSLLLAATGCSYIHPIGHIQSKQIYKIQIGSITAPNQTAIGVLDTNTWEFTLSAPVGGGSVLHSISGAGAIAGAGYFIGRGLEKGNHGTTTTVHQNTSASDPSPAPPITRQPPFGRWWR